MSPRHKGSSMTRPCSKGCGISDPGTGDPLGLVHSGAGVGQPSDVLHGQDEMLGGLEQPNCIIVKDVEETLPVHLQDLVPNLPSSIKRHIRRANLGIMGLSLGRYQREGTNIPPQTTPSSPGPDSRSHTSP